MTRRSPLDITFKHESSKRTAEETFKLLNPKSLRPTTIKRYMNKMVKAEQRELRRLVREKVEFHHEQWEFFKKLRSLIGNYHLSKQQFFIRQKRLERLPFCIDLSREPGWKFVDATRGIDLWRNRMLIPSIQRTNTGKLYLDIRIWMTKEDEEKTMVYPTRKGICIPIRYLKELRQLLTALDVRYKQEVRRQAREDAAGPPEY